LGLSSGPGVGAYQKRVRDVDKLKQRLVEVWSDFRQTIVDEAIDEWKKPLQDFRPAST